MTVWLYLALYVGFINFLTYAVWAMDKTYATHGARRVPESRLLALCLLGGWPTALFSTYRLQHKSAKLSFLIKMYLLIIAEVGGVGALIHYLQTHPGSLVEMTRWAEKPYTALVCAFDTKALCIQL